MSQSNPPIIARIEHDYAVLARNTAEGVRLNDEEDRLRDALDAIEAAIRDADEGIDAARAALVLSILGACPRSIPPVNEWTRLAGAPWQVRSGNRIFALVPARDANIPLEVDELPKAVTLAIVEIETEGRR